MIKRFKNDWTKYFKYSIAAARAKLKAEVAGSYLNWIWWILEPLCLMIIYTVIFGYVFQAREQYFGAFVYIGLLMWQLFERMIKQSIRLVKNNKSIVTKVYMPKFILVLTKMWVNGFKALISFGIVLLLVVFYRIPLSWNVFFCIPIILTIFLFAFGCGNILMHFGVYVADLTNVMNILLKFLFYATGIFYNVETRVGEWGPLLCRMNPVAFLIKSLRECLIYASTPEIGLLAAWFAASLILCVIGIRVVYKNENSYVKMI